VFETYKLDLTVTRIVIAEQSFRALGNGELVVVTKNDSLLSSLHLDLNAIAECDTETSTFTWESIAKHPQNALAKCIEKYLQQRTLTALIPPQKMDVQISGWTLVPMGGPCRVELTRHRVVAVSPTRIVWQHEGPGAWWLTFAEKSYEPQ